MLTIDARTMRHRVAPGKRRSELVFVAGFQRLEGDVLEVADGRVAAIETASDDDDVVAGRGERTRQVSANEPRSAGDGNSHLGRSRLHGTHLENALRRRADPWRCYRDGLIVASVFTLLINIVIRIGQLQ